MTITEFIGKAIEGGYEGSSALYVWRSLDMGNRIRPREYAWIFLDPKSWQAVGKVEGWDRQKPHTYERIQNGKRITATRMPSKSSNNWKKKMHRLIDALCEEKSIEQFLHNL